MNSEYRAEARKQYFKYFKIWFIVVAILLVVTVCVTLARVIGGEDGNERKNDRAPSERVYDYAEVLTAQEEEQLRALIAEKEQEIQADIVLVTIKEYMGESDAAWDDAMTKYADDFYDDNSYGYDGVYGSGVLLLDNYYEGQAGSRLSTCGEVYVRFGNYEIDRVLDAVYYGLEDGAFAAYSNYVYTVCDLMKAEEEEYGIPVLGILVISTVTALVYALVCLQQKKAEDTTRATTYVVGGKPTMKVQRDDYIRKSVAKTHIERSSGGGSSGGRGGSHVSSRGVSHGGGSRRR